jgi:predicted permease
MSHVKRFVRRIVNTLRSGRGERQLAREVASHLALLEEDFTRRGLSPDDARLAARRAFGGVEQAKDIQRDARTFVWIADARRDFLHAWRMFARAPGFAAVAIVTLALGIGANSAIFSVVHAVLLKPLPYPAAERLVRIVENIPATEESPVPQQRAVGVTLGDLERFRAQATLLSHVGVYASATVTLASHGEPARVEAVRLSPAVLAMLGVRPALGRLFEPHEEKPGADAVVVLSHAAWQRHAGGAVDVVGTHLTIDGRSVSVVGVMPPGFEFPDAQTELWLPYVLGGFMLRARMPPIARLADGASIEAASAQVTSILPHLSTTVEQREYGPARFELLRVQEQLIAPVRPALTMLAVAVAFVLLIACVNVANLLMSRACGRHRELVVRAAIGAGRSRLVRQLLAESMVLALCGGMLGVGLAVGSVGAFHRLAAILPRRDMSVDLGIPRLGEIGIDVTVLLFTLVATLITGLVAGLAPAMRSSRGQDADVLRQGASTMTSGLGLTEPKRLQGVLVVAEVSMAMLLLVGGGLLMHSFLRLSTVDPGFDAAHVLTFAVHRSASRTPQAPASLTSDEILDRIRTLPQVRVAGYAEILPLVRFKSGVRLRTTPDAPSTPPAPPAPGTQVPPETPDTRIVSRDFLTVMGIRVVEGRGFGPDDVAGRPKVMLINRTLARSGFLGPDPIGMRVYAAGKDPWEIVGIVEDVRQYGLDQAADPQIFIDVRQLPSGNPTPYFAVRADGDPGVLVPTLRQLVTQIDHRAIVTNVATMEQLVSNSLSRPRLYAVLLAVFACVAGLLAAIGVYGVMAYAVAQRTRELGVRIALGAERSAIMRLVLAGSMRVVLAGIALGLIGAVWLTRYLDRLLFDVSPLDPATFAAAALAFAIVAGVASYLPARRATVVDPMVALRHE